LAQQVRVRADVLVLIGDHGGEALLADGAIIGIRRIRPV
jgi:hypothetical protein